MSKFVKVMGRIL